MSLQKNILNTISYYDVLDYPLTSFEIWKYLTVADGRATEEDKCSLGNLVETLETGAIKKHIEEYRGFYFLRGRKELVERRIEKDKNSIEKYKLAQKVVRWLRFVPFVRMVAVAGTVAMKNCEPESDIDFLVALESGRIWTGRLLVTGMIHILGKRRYGDKIQDRICLNHYIASQSLEIKKKGLFAAGEYSFLYPLLGFDFYEEFGKSNRQWIGGYKPNYSFDELKPFRYVEATHASRALQNGFERLINFLGGARIETWLKEKQTTRIEKNPLTHKAGGYIEYNDDNLVFLPEPRLDEEFTKNFVKDLED